MSVKVISFYDKVELKPNKVGSGMCSVYETIETDNGFIYKKTNEINRQAIIDSEAENCDISILYKRLLKGDTSILNTREGVFLDATNIPKDVMEMNNYSKFIEKYFNESELLKAVYNSDYKAYFADYQKGINTIKSKIDAYSLSLINSLSKKADKKADKVESKSEVK